MDTRMDPCEGGLPAALVKAARSIVRRAAGEPVMVETRSGGDRAFSTFDLPRQAPAESERRPQA